MFFDDSKELEVSITVKYIVEIAGDITIDLHTEY